MRDNMTNARATTLPPSYQWHMPRTLSTSLQSYGIQNLWACVSAHVYAHFPVATKAVSTGMVLQSNKRAGEIWTLHQQYLGSQNTSILKDEQEKSYACH
jgi:hypothetical protein